MDVTIHLSDVGLSGWAATLKWYSRLRYNLPLNHVVVQVGDVILDSSPQHGSRFVPASAWIRASKPYQSVLIGQVDGFNPSGCSDLEGIPIRPWRFVMLDLLGISAPSCVSVSRQLLQRLGFTPPACTHPTHLLDWSISR